jgi:hypothetical protein
MIYNKVFIICYLEPSRMASQIMDSTKKAPVTNASSVVVFLTTVAAVLLVSASSGLFSESAGLDALNAFAQEQNQTATASGNNTCKVYDDMTATCLLFPTGMNDQDKLYGIEYVIPANQYNTLPEEEKKYWHYHLTELPRVNATTPDMTAEEAAKVKPILDETYGKVVYFWQYGDKLPIGEPKAIIIGDIVEQAEQQQEQNSTGQ